MPWCDLTDARLYYEVRGRGEPLVLVPGLGGTCRFFDPIAPLLAEHFTLITVDHRGGGLSVAKRPCRRLQDVTSDLFELLDHLQLDRTHLIGTSLGGMIAQRMAMDHPQRIDRLVLVACTHRFTPYLSAMIDLLANALRYFPWDVYERTIGVLATSPLFLDAHPQALEQRLQMRRHGHINRRQMVLQLRCLAASRVEDGDYHIAAPTLVIAGEHDPLIPHCYALQMAREIPDSAFLLVRGAGHNPLVEAASAVIPRVVAFLRESRPQTPMSVLSRRRREGSVCAAEAGVLEGSHDDPRARQPAAVVAGA